MTDGSDFVSISIEAIERTRKQGYKPDAAGEDSYKFSTAYLANVAAIKKESEKEREAVRKNIPDKQQEEQRPKQQDIGIDTSPPPEPPTSTGVSRVPSRDELFNMIKFMDDSRIEPLYFGMDDLVKEVKVISDRLKTLEDNKK